MLFDVKLSQCQPNAAQVVSKENNNRHIVERKSQCFIYHYHVDGSILKNVDGKRCDYIVEVVPASGTPIVFLIELKGSDLDAAIVQVEETIRRYKDPLSSYRVKPRVVLHKVRTHAVNGSNYRSFLKRYPDTRIGELILVDKV